MSNSSADGLIDPYRMAGRQQSLQDKVAVTILERANKLLASEAGEVFYALDFTTDREGFCVIEGELRGMLTLCCQRCLQPFLREVRCGFVVSPVENDKAAKLLPDGYEPVIIQNGKIDPIELLEDELILALPIVAKHDADEVECKQAIAIDIAIEATEDKVQNLNQPFQVLQTLQLNKKSQPAED